ncbi:LutC/YkgG family protein [Granulicella mallensis]|uniref:Lactate utilization protein B/C n=1 Tax=Granulicella mallensis (strain ATCC BAA-1857 / DSM 23137 / MP5ACTX8) TaxID=682795 RepID=G8NW34_GRAMM|nr:LUD domain-containing protein [Granulicella mallensis]AEU35454.1 Lactate utilization protein B/C [Granulicella mallensis MP5ACTX8]
MTAREEILARVRSALHTAPSDPVAAHARLSHTYNRIGKLSREACLELFIDRLVDYDSEILQVTTESEIPQAIAQALQHADEHRALVAPAFPAACLPAGFEFKPDNNLPTSEIEGVAAVVTTCEAAVAATGTIILVHDGAQGRRVITLMPDHHICLVHRDQVFELLPEAMTAIAGRTTKPITTISGPSATSDIEMTRIRGVHGPRRLTVILYG